MAPNQELRTLGSTLAEIQDHVLAARRHASTSERLAAIHQARALHALRARRGVWSRSLAIVSLAAVILLAVSIRARPLGFVVGASKAPGQLGVWVAALAPGNTALAFSDGSRVLLRSGAQARVVSTSKHGARVVLERGSVRSDVVPRADNDWFVVGGPFEIHVTGTSFDAGWEPDQQTLRVTMYEGHVSIRADCLSAPRWLGKGESLTLSCNAQRVPSASSQTPTLVPTMAAPSSTVALTVPAVSAPPGLVALHPSVGASAMSAVQPMLSAPRQALDWHTLARQGNYAAALSSVEQSGFDQACRTFSVNELLELGTTARLAGRAARATTAYAAVRQRFPGSDGAASAAFHLGQMVFDNDGAYAEARKWFVTYLSERPTGVLAAEALGRKLEAEQRAGDLRAAQATATAYLSRYPAGAHARLAHSLLAP